MVFTSAASTRRGLLLCAGLVAAAAAVGFGIVRNAQLDPDGVRQAVLSWGTWAPIAYIGLVALRPVVLVPSALLFITAGVLFGPIYGTLYAVTGGVITAVATFLLARRLGGEFIAARLPFRVQRLEAEWGAGMVALLNMMPGVPMTAVSCGAALARVPLPQYALAVCAGLTPRVLAFCVFGKFLLDFGAPQFAAAGLAIATLVALAVGFRRWDNRRSAVRAGDVEQALKGSRP
ncbi:MAG: TVP38/TMEM64 family protein [Candidatus Binatia bacterium]